MKFLVRFLILFFPLNVLANSDIQEFTTQNMTDLVVDNSKGNVRIIVTRDNKARVKTEKKAFNKNCSSDFRRTDKKLIVSVNDGNSFFSGAECDYNLEIQIPSKTNIKLSTGRGDVEIIGTEGDIDFSTGKGDIDIKATVKTLIGKSGMGNVEAQGLNGSVDLKTGNGFVKVTYTSVPEKGTAIIKTGTGDVTVFMPKESSIRADLKTGTGNKINEVGELEKANYKVSLKSGTGDVKIKGIQR